MPQTFFTKKAIKTATRALLLWTTLFVCQPSAAAYSPFYSCAGPYACLLTNYLGIKFADGTTQTTAAGGGGGTVSIGR